MREIWEIVGAEQLQTGTERPIRVDNLVRCLSKRYTEQSCGSNPTFDRTTERYPIPVPSPTASACFAPSLSVNARIRQ